MFMLKSTLKIISLIIACAFTLSSVPSYAIQDSVNDFALAPPLVIKPPCEIVNGYAITIPIPADISSEKLIEYIKEKTHGADLRKLLRISMDDTSSIVKSREETARNVIECFIREVAANSYNAIIDRLVEQKSSSLSFQGEINLEIFLERREVVINVIDNGKTIEFEGNGKTPKKRQRDEFYGHVGGYGFGAIWEARVISELGARVNRYPLKQGTKTEIRIPIEKMPSEFHIDKNEYLVFTNYNVIEFWNKETIRSYEQGVTAVGKSFRNRWAFVDISFLIGQMLVLTREHKLQNPKNILIPLIKKHIRNRNGESEILLEGYDIDAIEEVREGGEVTGFSLPVIRSGATKFMLTYNLQGGGMSIPLKDGTKIYLKTETIISAKPSRDEMAARSSRLQEIKKAGNASQKETEARQLLRTALACAWENSKGWKADELKVVWNGTFEVSLKCMLSEFPNVESLVDDIIGFSHGHNMKIEYVIYDADGLKITYTYFNYMEPEILGKIKRIDEVVDDVEKEMRESGMQDYFMSVDGRRPYGSTFSFRGWSIIQDFQKRGLLQPDKKFGDIGAGIGKMLILAALSDVGEIVAFENDSKLVKYGKKAIQILHDEGIIDGSKIRWVEGDWQEHMDEVHKLDAVYCYPPILKNNEFENWTMIIRSIMKHSAFFYDGHKPENNGYGLSGGTGALKERDWGSSQRDTPQPEADRAEMTQPSRDEMAARSSRLQKIKDKSPYGLTEEDRRYLGETAKYFDLQPEEFAKIINPLEIQKYAIALYILTSAESASADLPQISSFALSAFDEIGAGFFLHDLGHIVDDNAPLNLLDYEPWSDQAVQEDMTRFIDIFAVYTETTKAWRLILNTWKSLKIANPNVVLSLINDFMRHIEDIMKSREEIKKYFKDHIDKIDQGIAAQYPKAVERAERDCGSCLKALGKLREDILQSRADTLIDVNESIESALKPYRTDERIKLELELREQLPKCHGNIVKAGYIWTNLLGNSLYAIEKAVNEDKARKGRIAVKTRAVRVEDREYVEITFSDNGCGIPQELLKDRRIFQKFVTTKERGKGTGLGLYLIEQTVIEMGGTIDVRSEPGKGTTFILRLPMADNASSGQAIRLPIAIATPLDVKGNAPPHTAVMASSPVKILLINIVDKQKVAPSYPIGLYTLKTYMKQNYPDKCAVEIRDTQLDDLDSIMRYAKEWPAQIIGLSVMTENISVFDDFMNRLDASMQNNVRPLCVVGRQVATFGYKDLLKKYPEIVCVRGEGELALAGLNEFVQGKWDLRDVCNIAYSDKGTIVETKRMLLSDFESIGTVDHSELARYIKVGGGAWAEASRGCPWGLCKFCSISEFWGEPRRRREKSVEAIIAELKQFASMGVERFTFSDEAFIGYGIKGVKRARKIAQAIIDSGIKISFHTDIRASSIWNRNDTPEKRQLRIDTLKLLKKAGLVTAFIGIETGSPSQLKRYRKGSDIETMEAALKICKELGINVALGFIMIDPLVSKEEILENIAFVKRNKLLPHMSVPLNRLRIYSGEPYIETIREEEARLGRRFISDTFDRETLTYKVEDYKYPAVRVITEFVDRYDENEYDLFNAVRWFERFNPGIFGINQLDAYAYIKKAAEKFKENQVEFLYQLASLSDEDLLHTQKSEQIYIDTTAKRDELIEELREGIYARGHEKECDTILLQIQKYYGKSQEGEVVDAPQGDTLQAEAESERVHAINFRDAVKYVQAPPQAQPLIFALGTSWIRGYKRTKGGEAFEYLQGKDLNELITSTRTYCESKGIPFIVDDDDELLARINEEKARPGKENARVIVLAGKDAVVSDKFAALRNDGKNAFVVGVDNKELTDDSYVRLMEMLTLTLKLSMNFGIPPDSTPINIVWDDRLHIYIFIPHAEPMDYEQLEMRYEVQQSA
ncbi:MAG: ATP-binding protein [Candidatus Omnitrophota bacterium]